MDESRPPGEPNDYERAVRWYFSRQAARRQALENIYGTSYDGHKWASFEYRQSLALRGQMAEVTTGSPGRIERESVILMNLREIDRYEELRLGPRG